MLQIFLIVKQFSRKKNHEHFSELFSNLSEKKTECFSLLWDFKIEAEKWRHVSLKLFSGFLGFSVSNNSEKCLRMLLCFVFCFFSIFVILKNCYFDFLLILENPEKSAGFFLGICVWKKICWNQSPWNNFPNKNLRKLNSSN